MDIFSLIQHVNDFLLHHLILFIIQGIQLHRFCKNFFKLVPDCRDRISDDRKAALLPFHICVGNLHRLICIIDVQFLLLFLELPGKRLILRLKIVLSKRLHDRRSCIPCSSLLAIFISRLQRFQTPFH